MRALFHYAEAMRDAMVAEGIPSTQAADAANNCATPLAMSSTLDAYDTLLTRLQRQRQYGLDVSDEVIDRAARAASQVERFFDSDR